MVIFRSFLHLFSLVWLHWAASWIFRRIRTSSYNFCKKGYIWLNIWAKGGKKWPKICQWITYASTNNAVTSEVYIIFSWKKQKKNSDKLIRLPFWWLILLYTLQKMFSQNMPWYSKYSRNLVIFFIFSVYFNFAF